MKRILVMVLFMLLAAAAWALPSIQAVQAEVGSGNYAQAEQMMHEVIVARPGSARAHYVYAEILAHDGRFDAALQQAEAARQIAPNLGFTQPEEFRGFEQELESEQRAALSSPGQQTRRMGAPGLASGTHDGRVPAWAWTLGAAALAALLWRGFAPRPSAASFPPALPATPPAGLAAAGYGAPPPASGYGPNPVANAGGSGMLGTGLAAAGGVAAGMLVERLLDERGATAAVPGASAMGTGGALAPGLAAGAPEINPAATELEQRPIDFGQGNDNDWTDSWADDGGSGGMDDTSGGGSSTDGGW